MLNVKTFAVAAVGVIVAAIVAGGIATGQATSSDRDALVALYNATDGANWTNNTNWLTDAPLNEWHGVTTDTNGRVTRISLSYNALSGTIPSELGGLSNLERLLFSGNRLSGSIPSELGSLSNLEWLSLRNNRLSGPIPSQLGSLSNLTLLFLYDNALSGPIPSQLGNLSNLERLYLAGNELTGCVPSSLGKVPWNDFKDLALLFCDVAPPTVTPTPVQPTTTPTPNATSTPALLTTTPTPNATSTPALLTTTPIPTPVPPTATPTSTPSSTPAPTNTPTPVPNDRAVLVALYNATDGPNWKDNTNWLSDRSLREWHGVSTDNYGRVTYLNLSHNQLSGEIPSELGGLSNLERLFLDGNQLSGEIPSELGGLSNLQHLSLAGNGFTGCLPAGLAAVSDSDPGELRLRTCGPVPITTPDWVFAGNVPDAERTALRREMEAVRTWFFYQYGVEATDFTVLVGTTAEALDPVFRDVVGHDLLGAYVPPGYSGPTTQLPSPFVATADDGSPVLVLIYGSNPFNVLEEAIVHEYFHVLQHQLLAPSGKHLSEVHPYWLVEGMAMYVDYVYSYGGPSFGSRKTIYDDLGFAINHAEALTPRSLESIATESTFRDGCDPHPIFAYAIAFAGAEFLVEKAGEDSVVEFWRLFQQRSTWQQAFEEAFGMSIEDFYDSFSEWLPDQLPVDVMVSVSLHWPGKEALPSEVLISLRWRTNIRPEAVSTWPSSGVAWGGVANGAHTLIYPAGESWTGTLNLTFVTDECTWHVLGWYKDGELTDQRAEATVVQFSGEFQSLDWTIPARPDTLPRLEEQKPANCR